MIVAPDVEDYVIEYENAGSVYTLEGSESVFNLYQEGQLLRSQLAKEVALPETIMLYYAGETTRQYDTAKRTFDDAYDSKLKRTDNASFTFPCKANPSLAGLVCPQGRGNYTFSVCRRSGRLSKRLSVVRDHSSGCFFASQPRKMPPSRTEAMMKKASANRMNTKEGIRIRVYRFPKKLPRRIALPMPAM